jgi:NitT/TauT family transport system ATP-binding protein
MFNFSNVSVEFATSRGAVRAVDNVSLDIPKEKFVCFVGPSGCGKTTLLNAAAGLVTPSGGQILYDGAARNGFNKRVGYVTQNETLFPWRTAAENVQLGLELENVPKEQLHSLVAHYMSLVGLEQFHDHYPRQLSGGMRRRAALARTWIYEPETVLMDEPFGALDAQLKLAMQRQLLELWEKNRSTVIFVTHDLVEAVTLADQVVVFTSRPARVKAIREIDLPRPRDPYRLHFSPEVQAICAELWALLEDEFKGTLQ